MYPVFWTWNGDGARLVDVIRADVKLNSTQFAGMETNDTNLSIDLKLFISNAFTAIRFTLFTNTEKEITKIFKFLIIIVNHFLALFLVS